MERNRVLLVDDDASIRRLVSVKLANLGIASDQAESAESALALMNKNLYAVVLADIHLPGMDGVDMLAALKRISPLVQVIMLTGDESVERVIDCMDRGAVDFFAKQSDPALITDAIATALQRSRRWAGWLGRQPAGASAASVQ